MRFPPHFPFNWFDQVDPVLLATLLAPLPALLLDILPATLSSRFPGLLPNSSLPGAV